MEFALTMQEMGCNLLSLELPYHGERRKDKDLPAVQNMLKSIGHEQLNPFVCMIEDIQKTIDFIVEKKITRPGEIGVVGLAWGAANALYAMRKERRIRCGVVLLPVCKITNLVEFRSLEGQPVVEEYEPLNYVEKIAPKPLLFVTGENDNRANPVYASQLFEKLRPEYEAAGVADKLAYTMLAGVAHAYDSQMSDLAKEWFGKYLVGGEGGPSLG